MYQSGTQLDWKYFCAMLPLNRTCKEVAALVIAREDRDLPIGERLALRIHMKLCDTCPVFERQIFTVRNALRQWSSYQSDDDGL
jgi:hypothetical protein